jgi:hypothetical protein
MIQRPNSAQASFVMGTPPMVPQGYFSATNSQPHDNPEQLKSAIEGTSQCIPPWSWSHEMMFSSKTHFPIRTPGCKPAYDIHALLSLTRYIATRDRNSPATQKCKTPLSIRSCQRKRSVLWLDVSKYLTCHTVAPVVPTCLRANYNLHFCKYLTSLVRMVCVFSDVFRLLKTKIN